MHSKIANLRLRTKLLCSFSIVVAGLTCATLFMVHQTTKAHLQKTIEGDAKSALLTFQVIQHQHEVALSHKADLLATLADLRNADASTIRDSSQDPWQSDDCTLFALADPKGKVIAVHTSAERLDAATAENMLRRTLARRTPTGWWYGGGHLYQVMLQRIYDQDESGKTPLGSVIVGHEIDTREAHDLGAISSSEVVFWYGDDVVVSTLDPLKTAELASKIKALPQQGRISHDDEQFWANSIDLTPGVRPAVMLTILKSYNDANAYLARLNNLLIGLGVVAVLGGGTLIFLISSAFTHPLAHLARGVRALEGGDFTYPLEAKGGDEVAQVTRAFDRMRGTLKRNEANRQQLEGQLRQAQRMEAMGRLAGGVAHDFNNLLTVIKGHSQLLIESANTSESLLASSSQIAKAADRAASLTRQLLAFSRMQVLQPKVLELNALVADMGKMLTRLIREDVALSFLPGESLGRVKADAGQIEQVILNLTVNACDAMPNGGKLSIETRNVTVDEQIARTRPPMIPGEYVLLAVTDTGQGMDAETKARVFEPFFTTKELGKGTGLGLATVYGVVKQSGGYIWVESEPANGARFEIYFPRVFDPIDSLQESQKNTAPGGRNQTILIAEDEDAVRELATEFLKSAGYTVLSARNGGEALESVNRLRIPIDLLLTDVVMPNMRGPELAKQLKNLRAKTKVIFMSGYLEYGRSDETFAEDGLFLQKPFSRETLVDKVADALKTGPATQPATELTPTAAGN
jgi:signal transduction histidine kinase/ActR/RegA family two-component response regulator